MRIGARLFSGAVVTGAVVALGLAAIRAADTRTLTMAVQGTGSTIPAEGSTYPYDKGDDARLISVVELNSGFLFHHWECPGDPIHGLSTRAVDIHMDADKRVTAVFVDKVELSVAILGQGSVKPSGGQFGVGEFCRIVATPSDGWVFSHWLGEPLADMTGPSSVMSMVSDVSVTAVFKEAPSLTLTSSIEGLGRVEPCDGLFEQGAEQEVRAIPAYGFAFDHWGGDLNGSDNPTTLVFDTSKTITAVFAATADAPYTLNVTVEGGGSVRPSGGSFPLDVIQLKATPDDGWRFDRWKGDCVGAKTTVPLYMDGDKDVTAVFMGAYSLTTRVIGGGSVDPPDGAYDAGSSLRVWAVADKQYAFHHWEEHSVEIGTEPELSVTFDEHRNLTAVFVEGNTLTASVSPRSSAGWVAFAPGHPGGGTVDGMQAVTYLPGTEVEIEAIPRYGFAFDHWTGSDINGSSSIKESVTLDADKAVTAAFVPGHALSLHVLGDGGHVALAPSNEQVRGMNNSRSFPMGTAVTMTAVSGQYSRFVRWIGGELDGVTDGSVTITLDDDKSFTALFRSVFLGDATTAKLSFMAIGEGSLYLESSDGPIASREIAGFPMGDSVTVTAKPAKGWRFVAWRGRLSGVGATRTILMNRDSSVIAVFMETGSSDVGGDAERDDTPDALEKAN